MLIETPEISAKVINSRFLDKIQQGREKEAAARGTAMIRTKLREQSFARAIINPVEIDEDELDRSVDSDLPMKIVDKEPDCTATFVPFKGTGKRSWFSGPRYAIPFGKVESQRFSKSKYELMTYETDIRQVLSENAQKELGREEDSKFIETAIASVSNVAGQDLTAAGTLNAANVVAALKAHISREVPIGKILMSDNLYLDALLLPSTSVGDAIASRHYDEGVEDEKKLWGIPVITTIKEDLVPPNTFWVFSPDNYLGKNYLGNYYMLQDATLYIEQKADMITFWTYEAPGFGIGNTKAITRMTLT